MSEKGIRELFHFYGLRPFIREQWDEEKAVRMGFSRTTKDDYYDEFVCRALKAAGQDD